MLTRFDPFAEFSRLQDDVFRAFDGDARTQAAVYRPAVDIVEEKDAILLFAELPGLRAEDVHIELEKNVLTLHGERKTEKKSQGDGFARVERRWGKFARSFVLPETVDGAAIDADLKDGVLTVRIPKKAAEQPRKIAVRTGAAAKEPVGTA